MGINSPGDYQVHNPAGGWAAAAFQPSTEEVVQEPQRVPGKFRGLSWKRLMPGPFRRR